MTENTYQLLENYMLSCMVDSTHDKDHIYRVLYNALEIAKHEEAVDVDVLICAALLHDIGRKEQFEDESLCHAEVGARKAYVFLVEHNFDKAFAEKVSHCIYCHRYRSGNEPQSIEAKILFDADKLDVTGAIGIARTLIYRGQVSEPIYTLNAEGKVSSGENDEAFSFFREYKYKLEKLYDRFYTNYGAELAKKRREAAVTYYENLLAEVSEGYEQGNKELKRHLSAQ
uniref:HD domain-containing protein n=1 Tax=Acetatifactor sp. TaxID=1872090 RepID=UPI00405792C0